MKSAECFVIEEEDANNVLHYNPLTTYPVHAGDGSFQGMYHLLGLQESISAPEDLTQTTLKRYDALHYWFQEKDTDAEGFEIDSPAKRAGAAFAEHIRRINVQDLKMGEVPDWKRLRDNTSIISGPIIGEYTPFLATFLQELGEGVVTIDIDDFWGRENNSGWSVLYKLCNLEKDAKQVIEDRVCQHFDVRSALNYMSKAPHEPVTITSGNGEPSISETHRKWFWESRWLTDHMLTTMPQLRKNFHTLVITRALGRFQRDELSFNRLYRVLAMLGRVNTKIVFID